MTRDGATDRALGEAMANVFRPFGYGNGIERLRDFVLPAQWLSEFEGDTYAITCHAIDNALTFTLGVRTGNLRR